MTDIAESPYKSPSANLTDSTHTGTIHQFQRFSAWGVFGLSFITFGIYPIYWLCTRAKVANSIHENPIHQTWLSVLVVSTILSLGSNFIGESDLAIYATLAITLAYMVSYLAVLFKVKNRLEDIINNDSRNPQKLGPVLTFFFSAIYLQYKINECIDAESNGR